jgi:hypothetical protein
MCEHLIELDFYIKTRNIKEIIRGKTWYGVCSKKNKKAINKKQWNKIMEHGPTAHKDCLRFFVLQDKPGR